MGFYGFSHGVVDGEGFFCLKVVLEETELMQIFLRSKTMMQSGVIGMILETH